MPMIALALAGLGATVGTAMRQKKREKKYDQMADEQLALQQQRQQQFDELGRPLVGQGQDNMNILQSYLRRMASGDRGLTMQTMAPEINQASDMFRGSVAAQRNAFPRGGAGAAASANLPFQFQSAVNNAMFAARPQAAQQLGQLGANQTSLGLGAMGQGAGLTNNMLQYGLDARQQMMQQGAALGQGIGGIGQLLWMMNNQRSGGSADSLSPYTASQQGSMPGWGSSTLGFGNQSPSSNQGIYSIGNQSVGSIYSGRST